MDFEFIDNDEALAAFCASAEEQPVIGLDTEFVWRSTYYPQLGLIQIAWDKEHCALVDPLAVKDKTPFRKLMENPRVLKVFHELSSDLPILRRWCGCLPANVADTRLAAGFCGLTAQLSLAKLMASQLGTVLKKTETQTDWLQRPLTDAQLQYASDDVTLLPALYEKLRSLMQECGNLECFLEDMKLYEREEYYSEVPYSDAWKRVSRPAYLKFTKQDIGVLQCLAAWREKLAREEDITKNRIFRDEWLAEAAVKHPYTAEEVLSIRGIWQKTAKKYGADVAEIVVKAMKLTPDQWPEIFHTDLDQRLVKQASDRVVSLVKKRCESRKIDSAIAASRRECEAFAVAALNRKYPENSPLMQGWRYQLFAPSINDIAAELGHLGKKKR